MNRFTQLTTAGLLATTLLLTGCASKWDQRMAALKKDPMATATWEGIELLTTEESANDSYKSPGPSVTYCYKSAFSPDDTFTTLLETALGSDWKEESHLRTSQTAVASKKILYGGIYYSHATLVVTTNPKACDQASSANIQITLRAD